MTYGRLAQLVEHLLDVQEVTGSSPVPSTIQFVPEPDSLGKRVRVRFLFTGGSAKGLRRNSKRAKAGYHHDGGILPFVVGQCTLVKTLSYYYNVNGYCISILHSSNTFDLFLRHDSEFHCISCDFLMKLGKLFNLRLKNSTTLVYFTPNMWRFATCSVLHFLVHNVIKTVANKMTLSRKFKKLILSFIKSAKYI